ncbi:hypothetical protein BCR41DRAFT_402439 [Lobosporangium transversale]|uniref:PIN domain-like protein n=1 Tax=Lobosporangium transversale TaxID=64571 RepID=A0A1Y2G552_9FUNG|nr:hypothetical protein BCR41DRAFT_402439 [Lobosporangium transversale]ORY94310.1 hypothetical protein BCR41DRAFT_402439 [Lobosporangium transversale]|eukprot:XP_021875253.1 hypothetical protein BCR41DRAFT_402439 [Lobosporangium transversale]
MPRIQKGLREVHTLSTQDKNQLATALSSVFDVCLCAYEADPCIGCHNEENGRIVISQDSDFFAYERVCILVRPLPHRRRKFGVYDVDNVIQALNLPSHEHLVEAGENLGRNVASEEGRFRVASRVFTSGHQTSAQALPSNNEFDNLKQRLLNAKDHIEASRALSIHHVGERQKRSNRKNKSGSTKARSLGGPKKKDATKVDHSYSSKHPIKALTIGPLKASMARKGGLDADERDNITSQIRGAVVVLNQLRRYACWAIALDIERTMRLPGAARSRKEALDEVLDSTDYSFRLVTLLLSGQGGPNSAYTRTKIQGRVSVRPTNGPSTDIIKAALQERNGIACTTEHGRKRRRECDESETNGCGSDVTAGPREPKRARRKAFQTYFTSVHMTRSRSRKLAAAKSQREAEEGKAVRVGKQPSEIATIGSLYQAKTTGSARADPATRAIMPTQRLQKVVENPVRNWH